jgi:hypothetical protein
VVFFEAAVPLSPRCDSGAPCITRRAAVSGAVGGSGVVQRRRTARDPRAEAPPRHPFLQPPEHHRGQAHALITAAGEKTDDTDLFLVVGPP